MYMFSCDSNHIEQVLETLTKVDQNIEFAIEKCSNGSLCFLDKELELNNGKIKSKWYSKPVKGDKQCIFTTQFHLTGRDQM